MTNSREKFIKILNHKSPGEAVFDLGATVVTSISASTLSRLQTSLGISGKPVKLYEPYQGLGLVEEDMRKLIGVDIAGISPLYTSFGYKNENWKPWSLPDGTKVLVGEGFTVKKDEKGDFLIFPGGDLSCNPSARMPKNGFYFDPQERQPPINEKTLNARLDYKDDFQVFSEDELTYFEKQSKLLYENTDYGIIGQMELFPAGDVGLVTGTGIKNPKGIRSLVEWFISHHTRPDYIKEVLDFGSEIAIENLKLYKQAVGDRIQVIPIYGNDFGNQNGLTFSPDTYREIYRPFIKKVNNWVHKNTKWKVFFHSCGSIINLLDDLIEDGLDVINPVQTSAKGMDPKNLMEKYGKKLVFWGGGIEPTMLQFGRPEEVKAQALERIKIFSGKGGYVFNAIHNIQPNVPVENVLALIAAIKEYKSINDF